MAYTIKLRRGLSTDWTAVNPVLAEGETGWELDTRNFKQGDGTTAWNDLEYVIDENDRMPDPSELPDDKIMITFGGAWIIADVPETGGGSDPNAMLSAPAHLLYTYDTVEPVDPADGDIWTNPEDDPPEPEGLSEAEVEAIVEPMLIKDRRWYPEGVINLAKEFRDDADLTGAVRVDKDGTAVSRMVVARGGDSLSILLDGSATQDVAGEMHGYVWPYGLIVGEALETHIISAGRSYNYSFLGPVIADGVTYGSGNQAYFPRWAAGQTNFQDGLWTGWNNRASFAENNDAGLAPAHFLRIWRTATTTWVYQYSTDGKTWITIGTRTITLTPSHIGLAGGQWGGTGKTLYSIDHLRVTVP